MNERLDMFISVKSGLTRSNIQKLIKLGLISVNSKKEKAGYRVTEGDRITYTIPEELEGLLIPEKIPLQVIWEDEHIIVINKPPFMVMYPAAGNTSGTLMNAVASRCSSLTSPGAPLRPGVVHRLDKDTSGAIVIAKNNQSYYGLVEQFRNREVEKQYLALIYGSLKAASGEIRAAIGRSSADRKKMSTHTRRGKEAITQYEVLKKTGPASILKVKILTGRTHQIRVHFASLGHPVLGDKTYGKKSTLLIGQKTISIGRQMLHASSLKLRHPVTGEPLKFIAPVPEDMEKVIEELGS
jgi:23S rRNA pseudouridine1911/1915/1917 synthase